MIGWIAYSIAAGLLVLYFLERDERKALKVRVASLEVQAGKRWAP